jgi:FG-GAP-like repeat
MQYWLIHWGSTTCPATGGWMFFNNGGDDECYTNSNLLVPPQQPIANLGNLTVTAQANSGGLDSMIFSSGSTLYLVQNNANVLGLSTGWTAVEYNLVGDGNGTASTLNSGSSMTVRTSLDNGTTSAPVCVSGSFGGYTAETNNLNLQTPSGTTRSSTQPAMVWTQNSNSSSTAPCSAGVAVPAASKLVDTHDSNGDGLSDIVWRNGTSIAVWLMNGAQVELSAGTGSAPTTFTIAGQRDFNGDGTYDLLWRDSSGGTSIWFMIGTQVFSSAAVGNVGGTWSVAGTGDFNGDGKGDILWRDGSGIPRCG